MLGYAIFVDAGYLFAAGSVVLAGEKLSRASIGLNQAAVLKKLCESAQEKAAGPLLRIYWYDGLLPTGPSPEQVSLADADWVKLRLGIVNLFGQQKGVDSLIVTDLVELARNHAISDAILLSGDEDVRIGVQLAQTFGVRVHLIGIQSVNLNQARTLMQEADTTSEWSEADIREILSIKVGHKVSSAGTEPDSTYGVDDETSTKLDEVIEDLVANLQPEQLRMITLIDTGHRVPPEYDGRLLGASRGRLNRNLNQTERRYLREQFKEAAREELESS